MSKLLYFNDDDGKWYKVPQDVLEQMIGDARAKAGKALAESGDGEKALTVFQEEMKNINVLLKIYKGRFGDPYPDDPGQA